MKKAPLVGAFFVALCITSVATAGCPAPVQAERAEVAGVVDGDTLRLRDGRRVRLVGVNAPERHYKGRASEAYAEAAYRALADLVKASGGAVQLVPGEQAHDHYGRLLAHVYDRNGDNLEARLIADGLGYFVALAPNTRLAACHAAAEQVARQARKGLWRGPVVQPASALRKGGFAVLQGRVERVEHNRGGSWLELDGSVVVQVPSATKGLDRSALDRLVGERIEARGWVVDRHRHDRARWLLKVTHPAMLSRLR